MQPNEERYGRMEGGEECMYRTLLNKTDKVRREDDAFRINFGATARTMAARRSSNRRKEKTLFIKTERK